MGTATPAPPLGVSSRPTGFLGTRMVAARPETINADMAAAQPGDILVVPAGSRLPDLVIPPAKGGDWCTLMTSAESALPGMPARTDADKLITTPTLSGGDGSGGWRFVGLEVARDPAASMVYQLVVLSPGASRLAFDRCYVHGLDGQATRRGFMVNCADVSIAKTRVDRIHEPGADAQAICGWDATAFVLVEDCDLMAATENLMFGGADSASAARIPHDITVRRCRLSKDPAWLNVYPQKNLFELKSALRVVMEDCDLDGGAFQGAAFVLTPRNQDGNAPWSCVQDARFENIRVDHVGELIAFQTTDDGHPSGTLARIVYRNIRAETVARQGFHIGGAVPMEDLELSHCTILPAAYYAFHVEGPAPFFRRLTMTDNLFGFGAYGPNVLLKEDGVQDADSVIARNGLVNAGDVGDQQGVQRNVPWAMDAARFISIPSLAEVANYPALGWQEPVVTPPPEEPPPTPGAQLLGYFDGVTPTGQVRGWVVDLRYPTVRQTVSIYIDDVRVGVTPASASRPDVHEAHPDLDGNQGFAWLVPATYFDGQPHAYRCTVLEGPLGTVITATLTAPVEPPPEEPPPVTDPDLTQRVAALEAALGGIDLQLLYARVNAVESQLSEYKALNGVSLAALATRVTNLEGTGAEAPLVGRIAALEDWVAHAKAAWYGLVTFQLEDTDSYRARLQALALVAAPPPTPSS